MWVVRDGRPRDICEFRPLGNSGNSRLFPTFSRLSRRWQAGPKRGPNRCGFQKDRQGKRPFRRCALSCVAEKRRLLVGVPGARLAEALHRAPHRHRAHHGPEEQEAELRGHLVRHHHPEQRRQSRQRAGSLLNSAACPTSLRAVPNPRSGEAASHRGGTSVRAPPPPGPLARLPWLPRHAPRLRGKKRTRSKLTLERERRFELPTFSLGSTDKRSDEKPKQ